MPQQRDTSLPSAFARMSLIAIFNSIHPSRSSALLGGLSILALLLGTGCSSLPKARLPALSFAPASIQQRPIVWSDSESQILDSQLESPVHSFEKTNSTNPDLRLSKIGEPRFEAPTEQPVDYSSTFVTKKPSGYRRLLEDQKEFYRGDNLRRTATVFGISAIVANTDLDQDIADWYQEDVRSESLDDIAEVAKVFGEQWPIMGVYATASLAGRRWFGEDAPVTTWGDRSIRSMLVGVPPLLFLQKAIGSSRPRDIPASSDWDFWNDDNGASGHTFVGAVPFLVAAQIAETPREKAILVGLSMLTGWSRINDNDHYTSQVIVGWWLAYLATNSIERADAQNDLEISPAIIGDSIGIEATWRR